MEQNNHTFSQSSQSPAKGLKLIRVGRRWGSCAASNECRRRIGLPLWRSVWKFAAQLYYKEHKYSLEEQSPSLDDEAKTGWLGAERVKAARSSEILWDGKGVHHSGPGFPCNWTCADVWPSSKGWRSVRTWGRRITTPRNSSRGTSCSRLSSSRYNNEYTLRSESYFVTSAGYHVCAYPRKIWEQKKQVVRNRKYDSMNRTTTRQTLFNPKYQHQLLWQNVERKSLKILPTLTLSRFRSTLSPTLKSCWRILERNNQDSRNKKRWQLQTMHQRKVSKEPSRSGRLIVSKSAST